MKTLRLSLLFTFLFPALGLAFPRLAPKAPADLLHDAHFFANSVRKDITPAEANFLVEVHIGPETFARMEGAEVDGKIPEDVLKSYQEWIGDKPTCSAFFIENTHGRLYVGSSRHCFGFKENEVLPKSDVTFKDFATGHVGRSLGIIASDPQSDFFVFEVTFGENERLVREKISTLTLTYLSEPAGESVIAYGFPWDPGRHALPTKSESCKTFPNEYDPEYKKFFGSNYSQKSAESSSNVVTSSGNDFNKALAIARAGMYQIRHNCSIYGGNSGGPMVLAELPWVLIGLPETYSPSDQVFPEDNYGLMESPIRLLINQKQKLDTAGVVMYLIDRALLQKIRENPQLFAPSSKGN